ncbi:hypothetical protein QEN19_002974 [Hanseniaspora menglaensis]
MNQDTTSKLFNITDTSYLTKHSRAEILVNNTNSNISESIVDDDFEDISKDIDERIATIRNKIINDLIRQRLFEGKQREIEEYYIKKKKNVNVDYEMSLEEGDNMEIDDDSDENEIKELEEKLQEIAKMTDFLKEKKLAFEELKTKDENRCKDEINKYKNKAQDLQAMLEKDLLLKLEQKKKTLEIQKHEKDISIKSSKIKTQLISELLKLKIVTESQHKVKFLFEDKYHVLLHRKSGAWKLVEWVPRNKIYSMSLSERKQIEESFQKMDMKSWIINIRDLLLK